jgi:hypothetical protein
MKQQLHTFSRLFGISVISIILMLHGAAGFAVRPSPVRALPSKLQMKAEDFVGALPPTGFFDPLGLSIGRSDQEIKLWREAELKHGRVAMLAANGIIMSENFNPLFGGKVTGAAIYHFQQINSMYPQFWLILIGTIAFFETIQISRGYEAFGETTGDLGLANLRKDYISGDLGKIRLS